MLLEADCEIAGGVLRAVSRVGKAQASDAFVRLSIPLLNSDDPVDVRVAMRTTEVILSPQVLSSGSFQRTRSLTDSVVIVVTVALA